jgi:hypothetical protein
MDMPSVADGRFPEGLSSANFCERTFSQKWIFRLRQILRESPSYTSVLLLEICFLYDVCKLFVCLSYRHRYEIHSFINLASNSFLHSYKAEVQTIRIVYRPSLHPTNLSYVNSSTLQHTRSLTQAGCRCFITKVRIIINISLFIISLYRIIELNNLHKITI